jgi:hypothetical protein
MPIGDRLRKRHIRRSGKSGGVSPRGEFRQRVLVVGITTGVLCRGVDAAASQLLLAALTVRVRTEADFRRAAPAVADRASRSLISEA